MLSTCCSIYYFICFLYE